MSHDLDALLDELDQAGQTVTLFGQEWTLPPDVDAETMLRVQRTNMRLALAKVKGKEIKADEVVDDAVTLDALVEKMAGSENFAEWKKRGLTYRQLQLVAGRLWAIHTGDDDEGKAGPRGRAKKTKTSTATSRSA